jgi:hypothetical protein
MPRFLNTALAYGEMQQIVTNAKTQLVLISPYIKIPPEFFNRLQDTQKKNIKIIIVCKEDEFSKEEKDNLRQLQNLELHFEKDLHAKCFYNEESMVIGSLNLYDLSVKNNYEMGILLTINDDTKVFTEARNEAEHIISLSEQVRFKRRQINNVIPSSKQSNHPGNVEKKAQDMGSAMLKDIGNFINRKILQNGYCIRCGEKVPTDSGIPFCDKCYDSWYQSNNPDYEEKYCHTCGKPASTSKKKPQCRSCYKKSHSNSE